MLKDNADGAVVSVDGVLMVVRDLRNSKQREQSQAQPQGRVAPEMRTRVASGES